ncbi:hypothetical protein Clacol_000182 [Clathrus columnatus]|uniref:Uncharacterized protein n=1 Tax=Clathrus columnatus TaxID=1419009 RepID=A0AAV5A277_9AGAM|nr:hypothetical protein Clacol_000182 [Clathrus columnatus]
MSVVHLPPGKYTIKPIAYPLRFLTPHIGTPPLITAPPDLGIDQIWNLHYVDAVKSIFTLRSEDSTFPPLVSLPELPFSRIDCKPLRLVPQMHIVHPPDVEGVAYTAEGPDKKWAVEFDLVGSSPTQKWEFIRAGHKA